MPGQSWNEGISRCLYAGDISGQTLVPGVYKYDNGLLINSPGVTLDAEGDSVAVWIFQVSGNIAMSSDISVTLTNKTQAGNVFWVLAGDMEIGTNSHFEGVVLSQTAIHFLTGASFTGRALAQTEVTLQSNTIVQPNMVATGTDGEVNIAKDHTIGAAYPNPFNPMTLVTLNLAKEAMVHAQLYDMLGRLIKDLHRGTMNTGSYDIRIDGAKLSTRIYIVHLNINDATHVQKITLMK